MKLYPIREPAEYRDWAGQPDGPKYALVGAMTNKIHYVCFGLHAAEDLNRLLKAHRNDTGYTIYEIAPDQVSE